MTERWETPEAIIAARLRFEAAMPGYLAPKAFGVGRVAGDVVDFERINVVDHPMLPGAVLATVTGYRSGSASYRFHRAVLEEAIELLAPAEACTAFPHPNLAAWRRLRGDLGDGEVVVAAFVGDLDQPSDDDHAEALRQLALARRDEGSDGMARPNDLDSHR